MWCHVDTLVTVVDVIHLAPSIFILFYFICIRFIVL
jgi:hypothetical protein